MNKTNKYHKFDVKNKKKSINEHFSFKEEQQTLKDVKRDMEQKHYRNYHNILKSKDIDTLLQYEDQYGH